MSIVKHPTIRKDSTGFQRGEINSPSEKDSRAARWLTKLTTRVPALGCIVAGENGALEDMTLTY